MISKSGIKYTAAAAVVAMLGLTSAEAGLKQLEIKGKTSLAGYGIDYDGSSDSVFRMDADLDFKMKFSQAVSARIDLELDNSQASYGGTAGTNAYAGAPNRWGFGVDQAYFKLNDFLFRNFALALGKQNLNVSLRDNKTFNWAFGDPVGLVGTYSTRDLDLKGYFVKYNDDSTLASNSSNDNDQELFGITGEYWLNDDSLVLGYLNYASQTDASSAGSLDYNIVHYGVGLDYFIGESLEIYGEIAGQSIDGSALDGSAFQLTLGGEYAFTDFDMKPTFGLEYYLQSGADGNDPAWMAVAGSGGAAADNATLYAESNAVGALARDIAFGNGIVSYGNGSKGGYNVIRINGAIAPSKATKVGLGIHILSDEDTNTTGDDLGTEVDLYGTWKYSQDVTFKAGAFWLSDGDQNANDTMGVSASSALVF